MTLTLVVSTTGTTIFQTQNTANITVNYMDPNTLGSAQRTYSITGNTSSSEDYTFPSDVEYFQVITGQTLSDYENALENGAKGLSTYGVPNNTLGQFYVFGWQKVKKYYSLGSKNPDEYPDNSGNDYFEYNVPNIKLNENWGDHNIVFLVRGVDPNTPRQDIKYDLSKLYGYSMGNGPEVRGNFKLNVPIQPYSNANSDWRLPRHNKIGANGQNCSETGLPIYFNSFTFTPDNSQYQSYQNRNIKFYSSMDENNTTYNQNVKKYKQAIRTPQGLGESWSRMEGDGTGNDWRFNYRQNEVVEGGSLMMSKDSTRPEEGDWSYASPVYYKLNPNMSLPMLNSQKIVMRTDRLPTSDDTYKRFSLHQNKRFAIYTVDDTGESVSFNFGSSDSFGDGNSEDFLEDGGVVAQRILDTFSCEGMVPLECYSGNGETIGVLPEDDRCYYVDNKKEIKKMYKGCYYLITKNFAIAEDFQSITEWRARFRMMFALCNNVVSLTFVNNWVNGSLYMYSFQKDTLYNNPLSASTFNSNPSYQYCTDTIVYQEVNNSFFYRATPYNNGFIGKRAPVNNGGNYYKASNLRILGNPTTIMDLGPRDIFAKEICFNPDYQGYIIDKVASTSYKDTSDILQLMVISRLSDANFWEQVLGVGDGSIQKLFSRENSRLDGDVTQLLSINSEFGVTPFLGSNYSDDQIAYLENEDSNGRKQPVIGLYLSANTVNRDLISPGRQIFDDNTLVFLENTYSFTDQQVPYQPWNVKPGNKNYIFGTQENDWNVKTSVDIRTINYQTIDRLVGNPTFPSDTSTPTTQIPGFIYNSEIVNNQIEFKSTTTNNVSSLLVGAPYHFYYGLRIGKTAMNKFIDRFVVTQDTL